MDQPEIWTTDWLLEDPKNIQFEKASGVCKRCVGKLGSPVCTFRTTD
ncbi:MAG: hypothetical protein AAGH74_04720 [Pseudomonadota bacterium]